MSIISFFKKRENVFIHVFFLCMAILFIGRSIDFHFLTHFINGGDTHQWLNFKVFLEKGLYVWESSASGRLQPMAFWVVPYNLVLQIIYSVTNHLVLSINIFWILLFYFLEVSFYLFYSVFVSKKRAVLGVLLTVFNIYFLIVFHTPTALNLVAISGFPFLYYLLHRYLHKNKYIYLFLFVLMQLILFRTLNVLIIFNVIIVAMLLIENIYNHSIDIIKIIKKLSTISVLSILLLSMFAVNSAVYYATYSNDSLSDYNEKSLSYQKEFNLLNIYRYVPHYSFSENVGELPGLYYFDYSHIFLNNPFYILVSFIPLILIMLVLFGRKKRSITLIMSVLLVLIILAKGINEPFPSINKSLYSNDIYLTFFRSGAKYFMYIIIPLSVLLMVSLKRTRLSLILLFIYICSMIFLVFIIHKPIHKYWDTVLPISYIEFNDYLSNNVNNTDRILVLPITSHFVGYTDYSDGYSGPTRLYSMSNKQFLTKIHGTTLPRTYSDRIEEIQKNIDFVNKKSKILAYNYIIIEKDAIYSKYHKIKDYREYIEVIDLKKWTNIYENKDFILFKLNNKYFTGKIYTNSSNTSFERINPSMYKVSIGKLFTKDILSFLETYDAGWKIYLRKYADKKCIIRESYINNNIECVENGNSFGSGALFPMFSSEISKDSHTHIYDYANSWTIDPSYIKKNFSKEYYKENSDGSIDVELILYFKPQSYYYLGLLISGITFVSMIGYLIYDTRRRRKLNLKKT